MATNAKKMAKATKAKGTPKTGSKAQRVLELMKRKEGATLAEIAKATDWQNHKHSRLCQRARYEEARPEGRVDEEWGGGADVSDRELGFHRISLHGPPSKTGRLLLLAVRMKPMRMIQGLFILGTYSIQVRLCIDYGSRRRRQTWTL